MRPAGRVPEASDKHSLKMYSTKERTKRQRRKTEKEKKKRGAYNFLQSSKWGPFWQRAAEKPQIGATLELRGGGGGGRAGGGGERVSG